MSEMPPKQAQFFSVLLQLMDGAGGRAPTTRELREACGYRSTRSVGQFLDALETAGFIKRRHRHARSIKILRRG